MIRVKICFLTCLCLLFFATSSPAFYEYVDEHGITRYTDDINEVPFDQREGVKDINLEEEEEDSVKETAPETGNAGDGTSPASVTTQKDETKYDDAYKDLNEKVEALKREKKAIEKEDDRLLKDKMKLKPGDDIDEYNQKAAELKRRTRELEKKKEAFNDKIDKLNSEINDYNEEVAQKLESQLNEYEKIKRNGKK